MNQCPRLLDSRQTYYVNGACGERKYRCNERAKQVEHRSRSDADRKMRRLSLPKIDQQLREAKGQNCLDYEDNQGSRVHMQACWQAPVLINSGRITKRNERQGRQGKFRELDVWKLRSSLALSAGRI